MAYFYISLHILHEKMFNSMLHEQNIQAARYVVAILKKIPCFYLIRRAIPRYIYATVVHH